jgi:hypothetical protein
LLVTMRQYLALMRRSATSFRSVGRPRNHRALADAVRRRVLEGPGQTGVALRHAMAERAAGGPPLEAPYDDLARQIGQAAYKVTDAQVARVVEKAGSERATFELIVAPTLGAGLHRWHRARMPGQ